MLLSCHTNCSRLLTCAKKQRHPVVTIAQNGFEGFAYWLPKLHVLQELGASGLFHGCGNPTPTLELGKRESQLRWSSRVIERYAQVERKHDFIQCR
jgi:hypothetical protein